MTHKLLGRDKRLELPCIAKHTAQATRSILPYLCSMEGELIIRTSIDILTSSIDKLRYR